MNNSMNLKILTIQAKVRRLGYMKMILSLFNKSSYYPKTVFNQKIEIEAKNKYNEILLNHINTKGIIDLTKTGNSSKPYIEVMVSLQLLYAQSNKYQLSKYGKIFNVLSEKITNLDDNYFALSSYEKSFFLFFILQNDTLYLWSLLELIYNKNNKATIINIKKTFQESIIKNLESIKKYPNMSDSHKLKIKSIITRIKSWKKPQVYLEHVIKPRINWLLDLNMLEKDDFKQNNIVLSKKGLRLFNSLKLYIEKKIYIIKSIFIYEFF